MRQHIRAGPAAASPFTSSGREGVVPEDGDVSGWEQVGGEASEPAIADVPGGRSAGR